MHVEVMDTAADAVRRGSGTALSARDAGPRDECARRRPRILTFVDYYLPGYKGGGCLRTLANMVEQLSDSLEFYVVTRDRDLGDPVPYPSAAPGRWSTVGSARVRYVAPRSRESLFSIIRDARPDVVYINSFFSLRFGLRPLAAAAILRPGVPIVLAPRGEFSPGAMSLKRWKKRFYLSVLRASGLLRRVLWHVSTPHEKADVRRWMGKRARIRVAPDLSGPVPPPAGEPPRKEPGELRVVFISRVSRVKNLDLALRILEGVRGRVLLTVHGPLDDAEYWDDCQALMAQLPGNVRTAYGGPVPHDQIPAVLRRHHVFLLPTRGENFGHVILEALLAGLPVVVSDRTPWTGLRARGVGADVPLEDVAGFRSVLERYVEMDDTTYRAAARAARAYGEARSRDPALVQQNLDLFHAALRKP